MAAHVVRIVSLHLVLGNDHSVAALTLQSREKPANFLMQLLLFDLRSQRMPSVRLNLSLFDSGQDQFAPGALDDATSDAFLSRSAANPSTLASIQGATRAHLSGAEHFPEP